MRSAALKHVSVDLTDDQRKSLSEGKTILLRHHQLQGGSVKLALTAKKHNKVCKACRLGKGFKLNLSPDEYRISEEVSGGKLSWKGFVRGVKKAAKWYNQHLGKDTEFGRVVRRGLTGLADTAASTLVPAATLAFTGNPAAAAAAGTLARPLLKRGVAMVGDATGGFGVELHTMGGFLPTMHPAMHPPRSRLPTNDGYFAREHTTHGGSFLAAGYGIQDGTPMNPHASSSH